VQIKKEKEKRKMKRNISSNAGALLLISLILLSSLTFLSSNISYAQENITFTSGVTIGFTSTQTMTFQPETMSFIFGTGIRMQFQEVIPDGVLMGCDLILVSWPPGYTPPECSWWEVFDPLTGKPLGEIHIDGAGGPGEVHVDMVYPGPIPIPPGMPIWAEMKIPEVKPCDTFEVHEPTHWWPSPCTWWMFIDPETMQRFDFHVDWTNESCEFHIDKIYPGPFIPVFPLYELDAYSVGQIDEIHSCNWFEVLDPPGFVPTPCSWWEVLYPEGTPTGFEFHVDSVVDGKFHIDIVRPDPIIIPWGPTGTITVREKIDGISYCDWFKASDPGLTPETCSWWRITSPDIGDVEFHVDIANPDGTFHVDLVEPTTIPPTYEVTAERKIDDIIPCDWFSLYQGTLPGKCSYWRIISPQQWAGIIFHVDSNDGVSRFHIDEVQGELSPIEIPPWQVTAEPYQPPQPPPPEILDVELYPREVVDLGDPTSTQWHELHPSKTNYYHLSDWLPGMVLGPEDWVMMNDWWFLVDDLTIDIELRDIETEVRYWLDYECGYWTFNPEDPICTKWNEIKNSETGPPGWPRCWHLIDWEDNGDGRLSFCDYIMMAPNDPFPGAPHMFHVELVTVTLKLTDEGMQQYYLEFMGTLEEFEAMDYIHIPFGTMWHEILPEQGRQWVLTNWADQPFLAPSDRIVLTLKDPNTHEPIPGTEAEYHVDKVTVAMNLTNMGNLMTHIVKFEGSIVQFKYHQWGEPFGTQWHEVNPTYCRQWCIIDWYESQPNGILDYCDYILMVDKETGIIEEFHVESLSTDMWLTISHDIAVTDVKPYKTVVGQGFGCHVNVTVTNEGSFTETFDLTLYAETMPPGTPIGTATVSNLLKGATRTITFMWDTTGFAKGNYLIWAYAWPIIGETDTTDNTKIDGTVFVTIAGDVTGEGLCDMQDISILVDKFLAEPKDPRWDVNCDVNDDHIIDMADISIAVDNFLKDP
jgi:hypothetical protein